MPKPKTSALLQARMSSSRLPGKTLMSLQGKAVIEIIFERLKRSTLLDSTIVVTSTKPENDAIAYVAKEHDVPCFRGSEEDVLDRYYQAAQLYEVANIVRLTADCPLIDPEVIDQVIRLYHQSGAELVSNQLSESFPDGLDVCIFSFRALMLAWKHAALPPEREHVVPWILKHCQLQNHKLGAAIDFPCRENLSGERWTLDEASDYIFLQKLAEVLPVPIVDASWRDIRRTLDKNPQIRLANRHIARNEGYQESLRKDDEICR
jgi:spore coat polysaccharide biosynthesis protein SpsF